jgi:NAD(P)-dependent dehydrogenase (short-subunit alcohol dehydrogenase family)
VTPAYWENRMAVNLRHIYFCSQAAVPGMQAKGGGVILNFSSISWHLALPDLTLYMGAKAAIEGMTRGMARDLGGDNIRVNAIIPGGVRTPRQEALWHTPEEEARILAGHACRSAWRSPTWRRWPVPGIGQCGALLRPRVLCGRGMVRRLMYHTQRSTHNWRRKR